MTDDQPPKKPVARRVPAMPPLGAALTAVAVTASCTSNLAIGVPPAPKPTASSTKMVGLPDYGLSVGCVADLVILPGEPLTHAVVTRPADRTVIKRGRIVSSHGERQPQ